MRGRKISLLIPDMPDADALLPYLRRIDQARWYTNFGPLVQEFEQRLLGHFGKGHALASVSSATSGLELALSALQLGSGAPVLIPSLTFVATASSVIRAGYCPVAADVDPHSWLLTPDIARAAAERHKFSAVMPVTTFGCPQDAPAWDKFSEATGIPVLIDAAGGFGNQALGVRAAAVFSLHATKALGAGEGGFVVASDTGLIEHIRRLSNFGIQLPEGIVPQAGSNAKMSEYHAAVGLAALDRWPDRRARREQVQQDYAAMLQRLCPQVCLQQRPSRGVYTIMAVLLPEAANVATVMQRLQEEGIESRRWYHPLIPEHPGFAGTECAGGLDSARRLAGRIVGLPFHLHLDAGHREQIGTVLAAALT